MIENILDLKTEAGLIEGVHDPIRFQALWRARRIAAFLARHPEQIHKIAQGLSSYYSQHSSSAEMKLYGEHQLEILNQLAEETLHEIQKIQIDPYFPKDVIYSALQKENIESIELILSAALTPIRQNIGSCFATAVAMTVQRYDLRKFIDDCRALLQTLELKRTFQGEEYIAPLCPTWCVGDIPFSGQPNKVISLALHGADLGQKTLRKVLKTTKAYATYMAYFDHAFLKCWEFTLASFCEYKVEFYKWNLLSSLGLDPNQLGGIGEVIYQEISKKLDEANQALLDVQRDVETVYGQMRSAERLFKSATSYGQARTHRVGHMVGRYQFEQSLEHRDQLQVQAENYAHFFNYLVDGYQNLFNGYFQEVFDPQILDVNPEFFEDSPAGFRLIYKYGRAVSGQWKAIYNEKDYLEVLSDFFRMAETQLIADCEWQAGKQLIGVLTTAILQHLQSKVFIQGAQTRLRAMHRKAQTGAMHLNPWSYLSGGSMEHLLKCYFSVEKPLPKEEKIVKSPTELMTFFIETLKNAPIAVVESKAPLFAYSPVHAFRLMQHWEDCKKAWKSKEFTYTWVRDHYIYPGQTFFAKQTLSESEQRDLLSKLGIQEKTRQPGISLSDFRHQIVAAHPTCISDIDGYLFECKPGPKAFIFADTNWPGLFFAFAVNPGTLELDLWRSDPEFRHPKVMHMWRCDLTGQSQKPWGVFLHKSF